MNTRRMLYALLPVAFVIVSSCSDGERDGGSNRIAIQKHTVKYKVYSDDGSKLHINLYNRREEFDANGSWEGEFVTDEYYGRIGVHCNCNALITGEVYVDGKLKDKPSRNSSLDLCVDLKPNDVDNCEKQQKQD